MKILLTNARSLAPKIASFLTAFEEHQIDIAMVTESWLKDGQTLDRDVVDLEFGSGLQIIYKNRPKKGLNARRVGGGVSIIYSKARCSLRERRIKGNNFELVAAVGRVGKVQRQVAIFCLYIEPKMRVGDLTRLTDILREEILLLKTKGDPIILLGGDLNHRDLAPAIEDFADISRQNFDPTRGPACLDVLYSNVNFPSVVWPPLETLEGIRSDHSCVVFSGLVPRIHDFVWERSTTRKHTKQAVAEFGRALDNTDWDRVLPEGGSSTELTTAFEAYTGAIVDKLFPLKTTRKRSNEPEWITHAPGTNPTRAATCNLGRNQDGPENCQETLLRGPRRRPSQTSQSPP